MSEVMQWGAFGVLFAVLVALGYFIAKVAWPFVVRQVEGRHRENADIITRSEERLHKCEDRLADMGKAFAAAVHDQSEATRKVAENFEAAMKKLSGRNNK